MLNPEYLNKNKNYVGTNGISWKKFKKGLKRSQSVEFTCAQLNIDTLATKITIQHYSHLLIY
jgi:hypothetical protein